MQMNAHFASKALAASVFAIAAAIAPAAGFGQAIPAAYAEPVPDPGPGPDLQPQPEAGAVGGEDECGAGEVRGADGDCVPAMGAERATNDIQPEPEAQPRTTQDTVSSTTSGEGANLVPNINGDSCTGYWQSVACYEMDQDQVAVQPRSTLSSSP